MELAMQRQLAQDFHRLHQEGAPLVLFNAWDVATAKAVAKSAPAVATSSGAVAAALGYADGQNVPLEKVTDLVSRITAAVPVPVSIDIEAGYGDTPEAAVEAVISIMAEGAVGINIEDSLIGGKRQMIDASQHAAKIKAVRKASDAFGIPLFINARTDPFLMKIGTPEACLAHAVTRARVYADAGADGIFVPGLADLALIEQLVDLVEVPVNIMVMSPTIAIADLVTAGVKRVSLGPWPMMSMMRAIEQATAALTSTGQYSPFLKSER